MAMAGIVAAGVLGTAWLLGRSGPRPARSRGSAGAMLDSECTVIRGIAGDGALRIHAHVRNHGPSALPPVVLVGRHAAEIEELMPMAARIAREAPVYLPELPGQGESDADVRPLRPGELVDALISWMHARPLNGVLLVGARGAAGIVAQVALRSPELAAGLVLVAPADAGEGPERLEAMLTALTLPVRMLRAGRHADPAIVQFARALAGCAASPCPARRAI